MAEGYEHSAFDLNGILHTAHGSNYHRRPSSHFHSRRLSRRGSGRRIRRPIENDFVSVFDVPAPTISQRRRSSMFTPDLRSRYPLQDGMFLEPHGAGEQELTNEQLFQLLNRHNEHITSHGTLRLPSDVLSRRKSRFETEEFAPPEVRQGRDGVTPRNNDVKSEMLNIYNLRKMTQMSMEDEETPALGCCAEYFNRLKEFYKDTTLLKRTLNRIQGRFGSAIMEYFSFVKWLVMLNIFITLLTLPIILPQALMSAEPNGLESSSDTMVGNISYREISENCSSQYQAVLDANPKDQEYYYYIADFIQGDGFMERDTILFYGSYSPKKYSKVLTYDMAVAFILVAFAVLLISLIVILNSLSNYQRSAMVSTGGSEAKSEFSIAVLAGWDYGIVERQAIKVKKRMIMQELKQLLEQQRVKRVVDSRTTKQKVAVWIARVIVNILVLATFVGCGVGIYMVQTKAEEWLSAPSIRNSDDTLTTALKLLYEYMSTGLITAIYLIVPNLFYIVVKLERYTPTTELSITMARILFLRLSSLFFLLITTLNQLICKADDKAECGVNINTENCGSPMFTKGDLSLNKCWETYLGQQIYKLVVLDFFVLLVVTYVVEYPRQAIYKRFSETAFMKWLGQQEFDMPKNVMDILYNQTLCWIGVFFSPFIPLMITVKLFLVFWIKRGSLFANQKPSPQLSTTSAVSTFFMWVMLFSLIIAYFVLIVYMQFISPSQSCGPFRIYLTEDFKITSILGKIFEDLKLKNVIDVIQSFPVIISVIITLFVMWYLFVTISTGLSAKEKLYLDQFTKAVTDRQFLLGRVNNAIAQTMDGRLSSRTSSTSDDANNNDEPRMKQLYEPDNSSTTGNETSQITNYIPRKTSGGQTTSEFDIHMHGDDNTSGRPTTPQGQGLDARDTLERDDQLPQSSPKRQQSYDHDRIYTLEPAQGSGLKRYTPLIEDETQRVNSLNDAFQYKGFNSDQEEDEREHAYVQSFDNYAYDGSDEFTERPNQAQNITDYNPSTRTNTYPNREQGESKDYWGTIPYQNEAYDPEPDYD